MSTTIASIAQLLPPWVGQFATDLYRIDPKTGLCNRNVNDFAVVALFTVFILAVRVFFYTTFCPWIISGIKISAGKRGVRKFTEQAWMFMCHSISFSVGMYLIQGTPYANSVYGSLEATKHFWIDYPLGHRNLTPAFKTYYLMELAYWFHFVVALIYEHLQRVEYKRKIKMGLNVPEPYVRKDFWPLVLHHIVTIALIGASYYMNFIRIGHVTMIFLDVSDILLCFAKMFNYIPWVYVFFKEALFAIFAISWIVTRHIMIGVLCFSIYAQSLIYVPKIALVWDPEGLQTFYSMTVYWSFLGLFALLEILLFYWLWMIFRIVIQIMSGTNISDDRSDNDEELTPVVAEPKEKVLKSKKQLNANHTQAKTRKSSARRKSISETPKKK